MSKVQTGQCSTRGKQTKHGYAIVFPNPSDPKEKLFLHPTGLPNDFVRRPTLVGAALWTDYNEVYAYCQENQPEGRVEEISPGRLQNLRPENPRLLAMRLRLQQKVNQAKK